MRKPLIAGNWKLNMTIAQSLELVNTLKSQLSEINKVDIVVAPVFTSLNCVAEFLKGSNIAVSAQNCYPENKGAFTGEVSPDIIKDVGCRYSIVGHSERRQLFRESDIFINKKVRSLLAKELITILCVGETLAEREMNEMYNVIERQVTFGLHGVSPSDMRNVVVAYEPVWAIGTGKTASKKQAEEVHAFIRRTLTDKFNDEIANETRIIYGGSVKPDNIDELMDQPNIDGTLVGGASLNSADFCRIVNFQRI